jgi:hypothetical protein
MLSSRFDMLVASTKANEVSTFRGGSIRARILDCSIIPFWLITFDSTCHLVCSSLPVASMSVLSHARGSVDGVTVMTSQLGNGGVGVAVTTPGINVHGSLSATRGHGGYGVGVIGVGFGVAVGIGVLVALGTFVMVGVCCNRLAAIHVSSIGARPENDGGAGEGEV